MDKTTKVKRRADYFIKANDERFNDCNEPIDIPTGNIVYIEALKDNGSRLYVAEAGGVIRTYKTTYKLNKIMQRYPMLPLVKVHRSFAINTEFLHYSDAKAVYLTKSHIAEKEIHGERCIRIEFSGTDMRSEFQEYCIIHQIVGKRFRIRSPQ